VNAKEAGNALLKARNFEGAILKYSEAISLDGSQVRSIIAARMGVVAWKRVEAVLCCRSRPSIRTARWLSAS